MGEVSKPIDGGEPSLMRRAIRLLTTVGLKPTAMFVRPYGTTVAKDPKSQMALI